jgi:plasmid maintenance system antidote protein VapI
MAKRLPEAKDPRETAGLIKCVPKIHLGEVLTARGITQTDFERAMGVGRKSTSHWVNGGRRMSDAAVVRASWLLEVHPLYLLDMTDDPQIYGGSESQFASVRPMQMRRSMVRAVTMLNDPIQLMGTEVNYEDGFVFVYHLAGFEQKGRLVVPGEHIPSDKELWFNEMTVSDITEADAMAEVFASIENTLISQTRKSLVIMPGDYRDPATLTHALFDYALKETRDDQVDRMLKTLTGICIGRGASRGETDRYDGAANSALKRPDDGRSGLTDTAKSMLEFRARFTAAADQSTTDQHRYTASKK